MRVRGCVPFRGMYVLWLGMYVPARGTERLSPQGVETLGRTVAQVARSQAAAGGCSTCDSGRTGGWALKIYKIYKLWVSFKKNN